MDIRRTLIAMRELLTPDGAWCQEACWRDKRGRAVVHMEKAASYCLYGAAQASLGGIFSVHDAVCEFLSDQVPPDSFGFISWNDTKGRTQAEVLAFLDECIAEFEPAPEIAPIMVRELEDA